MQEKLVITSSYYNEHTKELELYVNNAIHCTIYYDKHPNEMEIGEVIEDIEWEHNHFINN